MSQKILTAGTAIAAIAVGMRQLSAFPAHSSSAMQDTATPSSKSIDLTRSRSWFGCSACWVGDVNGDGHDDLAVGDVTFCIGQDEVGIVAIISSKDGAVLGTIRPEAGERYYGRQVKMLSGIQGGDLPILAISGLRENSNGELVGFVRAISVKGQTIFEASDAEGGRDFGMVMSTGEDADLDGVDDLIVGAPGWDSLGVCYVYAGGTGRLIHKWNDKGLGVRACSSVALLGDIDKDGIPEVAIGSPAIPAHAENLSAVSVRSGKTGEQVLLLVEPDRVRLFGSSITDTGDINADGISDFAVGAPAGYSRPKWKEYPSSAGRKPWGCVYLFSGADGKVIGTVSNEAGLRRPAEATTLSFVGDSFGERIVFNSGGEGIGSSCLLVSNHMSLPAGAIHCFAIPSLDCKWSFYGAITDSFGDFHLGYDLVDGGNGMDRFGVSTCNPWGGEDPCIRILRTIDGSELSRIASSDVRPRIGEKVR